MPRDANGNYSLPLPPVTAGATITSVWGNTTTDDLAIAMTDSLSRTGDGGMLGPLGFADGTEALPGISFVNEPGSGLSRISTGILGMSVQGVAYVRYSANNQLEVFRDAAWQTVLSAKPIGALEFGYDPNGILFGTWEQLPEGTFILNTVAGADVAGGDNDAVVVDHLHSIAHDHPSTSTSSNGNHQHNLNIQSNESGTPSNVAGGSPRNDEGTDNNAVQTDGAHTHTLNLPNFVGNSGSAGVSGTDKNKPLYKGVEIWERTA